jgi:hypothetical protein
MGCGEVVPTHLCPEHGWVRRVVHVCDRRECPSCAGTCRGFSSCPVGLPPHPGGEWAHQEAARATMKWERDLRWLGKGRASVRQVVVSVPKERFPEVSDHRAVIARVRQSALKAIRKLAWRGKENYLGSVVVHLYRGCDGRYEEWGPHAHVLCLGVDVRKVIAYERRSHVVVKQVNGRDGGFADYRGFVLRRHLVYELGHVAVVERGHSVVWFGRLKKCAPVDDDEPGEAPVPTCPDCDRPMERWGLDDELIQTLDGGWVRQFVGCSGMVRIPVKLLPGPPPRERWRPKRAAAPAPRPRDRY